MFLIKMESNKPQSFISYYLVDTYETFMLTTKNNNTL